MELLRRLTELATTTFGRPVVILGTEDAPVADGGSQPLSASEQATFAELVRFARSGIVGITFAEWQDRRADLNLLRQYQGVASPTLAQTVAATKAQNRLLAALLRDTP